MKTTKLVIKKGKIIQLRKTKQHMPTHVTSKGKKKKEKHI